uniref:Amidophosphoribosyltransferase n=1 Tax=uncultured Armatimonadetes bacterium TaxID=157466 RepID=A0A6J4IYW0_9BACT|nr:Amidophosphoribosyltransferase [uncultured Armatimonadetes bacterium]
MDSEEQTAAVDFWDDADDTPQEECGIFGVFAPGEDVARLTFFGLFALQHRGQESAGIAVSDGETMRMHKDMGLVTQVFDEEVLAGLKGHVAIGHTRYSTTGSSVLRNAQPLQCCLHTGTVAVAHNGNLINTEELRSEMEARGIPFETSNDSEVIARLIADQPQAHTVAEALRAAMKRVRGAYSLAIMTEDQLVGVRDPYGVRPLCLGRLGADKWVLASETCALNTVGATFVRELAPGEIVVIDADGVRSAPGVPMERPALCMLEMIYFARPDSVMYGQSIHAARQRMGRELFREHPVPGGADLVIPIPDSGTPAALGFAEASGIPFGEGVIKSRYIHRTFIQPDQRMRDLGVRMKLTPIREALEGKRVVMVDDSIVRGTTTGNIVRLLFDAGAKEVHVRISAPPVQFPCFYGVDLANQDQLVAASHTVEEIRRLIGATTLGFLSTGGLARAVHVTNDNFCLACFTGDYPIEIPPHVKVSKFALEMPMAANGVGTARFATAAHSRDVGYDE